MLPVYIGAGVVVASAAVAIGALVAKQSAQNNANTEANLIMSNLDTCPAPSTATIAQMNACTNFANDNNLWNQDATVANVAVGVGVAALVGTVVYWIAAKKRGGSASDPATATDTKIVPVVGTSFGGLSMSTTF
jgi:hypothetical protein